MIWNIPIKKQSGAMWGSMYTMIDLSPNGTAWWIVIQTGFKQQHGS